jgi:hypothetical protein
MLPPAKASSLTDRQNKYVSMMQMVHGFERLNGSVDMIINGLFLVDGLLMRAIHQQRERDLRRNVVLDQADLTKRARFQSCDDAGHAGVCSTWLQDGLAWWRRSVRRW